MVVAHRPRCAGMGSAARCARAARASARGSSSSTCSATCRAISGSDAAISRPAELAALGLVPQDLLNPAALPRVRPLLDALIDEALLRLDEGRAYTLAVPRREARLRLASLWPLLIGLGTLARLRRRREPARPRRHGQGVRAARSGGSSPARSPSCGPTAGSAPGPAASPPPRAVADADARGPRLGRALLRAEPGAGAPRGRRARRRASTAKWRCGPVTRPVAPTVPMTWPAATGSPGATRVSVRWK